MREPSGCERVKRQMAICLTISRWVRLSGCYAGYNAPPAARCSDNQMDDNADTHQKNQPDSVISNGVWYNINFQYFSILITIVSAIFMVVVSQMTAAPDYARIQGLTFATTSEAEKEVTRQSWSCGEVAASAFVLVAIVWGYLYLKGIVG